MQKNSIPVNKKFEKHASSVASKSENLIKNIIPQKIEELDKLLDSEEFNFYHQEQLVHHAVVIPTQRIFSGRRETLNNNELKEKDDSEESKIITEVITSLSVSSDNALPIPINSIISKRMGILKPYIRDLVEHAGLLKMWITFLIPHVEDGNNFGVSIQEDVLKEIKSVEIDASAYYIWIQDYYTDRGKLISKVLKYPEIDDYRRGVAELDERKLFGVRDLVSDIRNHYASMYDLIVKNWDKILVPRSSNSENMY